MQTAIDDALAAWNKAPWHIRMMAGAYVSPLLIALTAIAEEVRKMQNEKGSLEQMMRESIGDPQKSIDRLASLVAEKLMNGASHG